LKEQRKPVEGMNIHMEKPLWMGDDYKDQNEQKICQNVLTSQGSSKSITKCSSSYTSSDEQFNII
jgi:hypothetical protein